MKSKKPTQKKTLSANISDMNIRSNTYEITKPQKSDIKIITLNNSSKNILTPILTLLSTFYEESNLLSGNNSYPPYAPLLIFKIPSTKDDETHNHKITKKVVRGNSKEWIDELVVSIQHLFNIPIVINPSLTKGINHQ